MKIPEPKFVLKEPNSDKSTLISMVMRFDSQRIFYSTGESVLPINWDSTQQRCKRSVKFHEGSDINMWLDNLSQEAKNIFRNFKLEGVTPTPALVKDELEKKFNPKKLKQPLSFVKFVERYISECMSIKNPHTIKTYRTTLNHLLNFSRSTNVVLDFHTIDLSFYNLFISYLSMDAELARNTLGKHIRTLKIFLNEATERGINKKLDYKKRAFKVPYEEVDKIYLTLPEIDQLYKHDFSFMPHLERVRDLFIIACFTGLRFSDFTNIQPENIIINEKGDEFIKMRTQKTNEDVVIPLNKIVRQIFEKYSGKIPEPISNQKMNEYIKVICQIAKIDTPIIIKKIHKGQVEQKLYKKYQLVSCHTSRRSFATNLFLEGVSSLAIKQFTGHRSDRAFLGYIRVTKQENANKLVEHPFFN